MTILRIAAIAAASCTTIAATADVVFQNSRDNGWFTPFDSGTPADIRYGDSGWISDGAAGPVELGSITLGLAVAGPADAGTTDLTFTFNDGSPSGLVFGSGAILFETTIEDVALPAAADGEIIDFEITVPIPGVVTAGGFNNVGWSIGVANFAYDGQFGFQVASTKAQAIGFYTVNASFFDGVEWSLFSFGGDPVTGVANFVATIETPTTCAGDLDGNGEVNGADVSVLLGAWGTPDADLDGDGDTGGSDLAIVLADWGCTG